MSPARLGEELDALLDELRAANERLHASSARQREAVRAANTRALDACAREQEDVARRLGALDARRRDLVARACSSLPTLAPRERSRVTLSDLAACAPETRRGVLIRKATALRDFLHSVQHDIAGVRAATLSLMAHVEGIVRQVGRELSHAGTYTARGVVAPVAGIISAVDIRS
jgi:hypothetical protein